MKAYSFLNISVILNSVPASGFDEGDDCVKFERLNDAAMHKVGADGKMMLALSADKSGKATLRFLQTSPTNKILNDLCLAQGEGPMFFVPVSCGFKDAYRNDIAVGTVGYILKPADLVRGVNGNAVEWEIIFERLDYKLGNPAFGGLTALAESL